MIKQTKGFTLVELLVVVAIIALLVSILMPTLNKAKEQTLRVICASNLRHCGIALHVYAASNDGYFPPGAPAGLQACVYRCHVWGYDWDLREYIRPFVGNFELWKCPALPMAASIDDPDNVYVAPSCTYRYYPGRRYPQFAKSGTEQYNNPQLQPIRHENVDNAGGRVMMQDAFVDLWWSTESMVLFNHGTGKLSHSPTGTNPSYANRITLSIGGLAPPGDGAGLLFYDSHAEWSGFNELEPVGSILQSYPTTLVYSRLP